MAFRTAPPSTVTPGRSRGSGLGPLPLIWNLGHPRPPGPCPVAMGHRAKKPLSLRLPLGPGPGSPSPRPPGAARLGRRSPQHCWDTVAEPRARPRHASHRAWCGPFQPHSPPPHAGSRGGTEPVTCTCAHTCTRNTHTHTWHMHVTCASHACTCAHTTRCSLTCAHPMCTAPTHAPPRTLLEYPGSHLELGQPLDGLERPQDTQDPQGLDGVDVFPFGAPGRQKRRMQKQVARPRWLPQSLLGLRHTPACCLGSQGGGPRSTTGHRSSAWGQGLRKHGAGQVSSSRWVENRASRWQASSRCHCPVLSGPPHTSDLRPAQGQPGSLQALCPCSGPPGRASTCLDLPACPLSVALTPPHNVTLTEMEEERVGARAGRRIRRVQRQRRDWVTDRPKGRGRRATEGQEGRTGGW